MTEDQMKPCDQLAVYSLGGLSDDEEKVFQRHLEQCADCRRELEQLRSVTELLPLAAEPRPVPAGMRQRVLSRVFESSPYPTDPTDPIDRPDPAATTSAAASRRVSGGALWRRGAAVAATAAVIVLAVYSSLLRHDLQQLQQRLDGAEQQLALANQPAQGRKVDQVVTLSPTAQDIVAQGLATIVIDDKGTHLLVQAENMPALKGTQAYQVWLLKDNTPYNAGTFVTAQGTGALYYTFEPSGYDTIAITLEPDANGDKPRGQIVLAAPLKS